MTTLRAVCVLVFSLPAAFRCLAGPTAWSTSLSSRLQLDIAVAQSDYWRPKLGLAVTQVPKLEALLAPSS
jgi:hypothetical protein